MQHFIKPCLALAALAAPSTAMAAQPLDLTHQVFVERTTIMPGGQTKISLMSPTKVLPGDQLVFILRYRNPNPTASDSVAVTNPLPPAVTYQQASGGALVSVDGGKNWGVLADLIVTEKGNKQRPARAEDVTHIKWQFNQPVPAGSSGKLTFRGVVR